METNLRRVAVALSIVAAAVGGVTIEAHPGLGTLLVVVGVGGAMYMYLSSQTTQVKNEAFFDMTATMLSSGGLGNPYTAQIMVRLQRVGAIRMLLSI